VAAASDVHGPRGGPCSDVFTRPVAVASSRPDSAAPAANPLLGSPHGARPPLRGPTAEPSPCRQGFPAATTTRCLDDTTAKWAPAVGASREGEPCDPGVNEATVVDDAQGVSHMDGEIKGRSSPRCAKFTGSLAIITVIQGIHVACTTVCTLMPLLMPSPFPSARPT